MSYFLIFFLNFPFYYRYYSSSQVWQHTPFVPAAGRPRRTDLQELQASLVHRASSRTIRAEQRNPVLKKRKRKEERERGREREKEIYK